ncbi:methyltransferase domain-containing protein [Alginatibacterium sediminis]|uniref:Methyltransferase domain-containing protein n=1 Tax=Alginatibacterium sediminis TaxID=2164068 RepID=A0A420E9Y4_9ALTE|nr:methyltransferase domain-containing protein [Alginatibacterium sediminis]RKF17493.1 methyltransferase domain-containing protein [Alginatibacterium sediminis]
MSSSILRCPLCEQRLKQSPGGMKCDAGHQYDRAKEGYLNLLPVQFKNTLNPGDNQDMMLSRQTFLQSGQFNFLIDALGSSISDLLEGQTQPIELLDIGCGEGFYTQQLSQQLADNIKFSGIDISKSAIRLASKHAKRHSLAIDYWVASNNRLPVLDNSVDLALKVFAPCDASEMQRCLKPKASFLTVTPGSKHLWQLKSKIYSAPIEHDEKPEQFDGFTHISCDKISKESEIDFPTMKALAMMTPFAWKISQDELDALCQSIDSMQYQFIINRYQNC